MVKITCRLQDDPDGERVLGFVIDPSKRPAQKTVSLIFNLFDELNRLVPAK